MREPIAAHLTTEQLLRSLDDELSITEAAAVELHMAACPECAARYHDLGVLSVRVESLVSSLPVESSHDGRTALVSSLAQRDAAATSPRFKRRGLWHATWSAAIAAGVVIAAMLSPRLQNAKGTANEAPMGSTSPQVLQVAGENFTALPYSNTDLPLSAPHIVQMEVSVSSLADAGVVFEPMSSEQSNPDRSVLADVLLGVDGEPLGVHIIGED